MCSPAGSEDCCMFCEMVVAVLDFRIAVFSIFDKVTRCPAARAALRLFLCDVSLLLETALLGKQFITRMTLCFFV